MKDRRISLGDLIVVAGTCIVMTVLLFTCQCSDTNTITETEYVEVEASLDSAEMGACFLCSYTQGGYSLASTGYYCNELADLDTNTWVCVWAPFTDTLGPNP